MKLVVFAHTPPPVHGQSLMVQYMVDGFGPDRRATNRSEASNSHQSLKYGIDIYHVNARVSSDLPDVGRARPGKLLRLIGYCAEALWIRIKHGVTTMYYVPAPPRRAAIYRDWIVMAICRPWFRTMIFHWHAVGLGEWLERRATLLERWITHFLLGRVNTAIVLSRFNQSDAEVLRPKRTVIVSNGIPDPCPDFAHTLASVRRDRAVLLQRLYGASLSTSGAHRAQRPAEIVRVLYLAHCTRDKGFFDAIEGVRLANAIMSEQKKPISFELTLVGAFLKEHEKAEFEALRSSIGAGSWLRYLGFMGEPEKWDAYRRADVFCFPTYFPFEAQPMNLIEALAFGLPIVTTRWRSIPEYFPADYAGLIEPRRPEQVASAIIAVMTENGAKFRQIFENRFSLGCHLENLAMAIKGSFQAQPV